MCGFPCPNKYKSNLKFPEAIQYYILNTTVLKHCKFIKIITNEHGQIKNSLFDMAMEFYIV